MKRDNDDLNAKISRKWNEREPEEAEEVEEIEEVKRPGRRSREDEGETTRPVRRRRPSRDEGEEDEAPRRRQRRRNSNVTKMVVLSLLGLAAFVGCIILLVVLLQPRDCIGPFKGLMTSYLNDPLKGNAPPNTPVQGKMVAVSSLAGGLDDIHFSLSSSVKANTPEEVKTVVRVNSGSNKVGQYSNGAPGYQYFCNVQVIDWTTKQIVATRNFEGSMPPKTIQTKSSSAVYGSNPRSDVVSYLDGLPR